MIGNFYDALLEQIKAHEEVICNGRGIDSYEKYKEELGIIKGLWIAAGVYDRILKEMEKDVEQF